MRPLTFTILNFLWIINKILSTLSNNILKCIWNKLHSKSFTPTKKKKKNHSRKVDQNRPNGPSGPKQTEWIEGTEVDQNRLNWTYSLFCVIILVLLSKALLFFSLKVNTFPFILIWCWCNFQLQKYLDLWWDLYTKKLTHPQPSTKRWILK